MAILIDGLDMPEQGEYKHLRIYDNGDVTVEMSDGEAVIAHAIPAADVRPVVKAQWVYTDMSRLVCSNCGNPVAFALKEDGWHHGDFCPNCGADMEES